MSRFIPRGVAVAGLGKRFVAALIDGLVPALIGGGLSVLMQLSTNPTVLLVGGIAGTVLLGAYGLVQWWAYGSRGAGLGAKVMGLRLVGMSDGNPIGWWRFFLRQLVYSALMGTVIGGLALLVFLVIHERRQGWHDLAVKAVMVQPKEKSAGERTSSQKKATGAGTVALPPHLSSAFAPGGSGQDSSNRDSWGGFAPEQGSSLPPAWMPKLETEPIIDTQASADPMPSTQAYNAPGVDPYQQPNPYLPGGQVPQQPPARQPAPGPQGQQVPQQWPAQQQFGQQSQPQWPGDGGSQPGGAQPQQAFGQQPGQGVQSGVPSWQQPAPGTPSQSVQAPTPSQPPPAEQPRPARPVPPVNQGWIPLPTPTSVLESSQKSELPRVRQRDFGEVDDDDDGTRISKPLGDGSRPGDEGWYLRLDDSREVELNVTVLLGRNPQKTQGDPEVHLVPAGGDGRMISRTHVLIGTDPRGVYVVDRGSTNGTALVTAGGDLEPCPVGTQVRVREGQQVSYGNRWFTVLRRPAH